MAANTTHLLQGLNDYREILEQHLVHLREDFEVLDRDWQALSNVYEGAAAEDFRNYWLRTQFGFKEYSEVTMRIHRLLQERIDALSDVNRRTIIGG